jgi:hypothetical protein
MVSAVLAVCFINKVANGAGCWWEYVTTPWFYGTASTIFYNHSNPSGFKIHS